MVMFFFVCVVSIAGNGKQQLPQRFFVGVGRGNFVFCRVFIFIIFIIFILKIW